MKTTRAAILLSVVVACALPSCSSSKRKIDDSLIGEWQAVKVFEDGNPAHQDIVKLTVWKFTKEKVFRTRISTTTTQESFRLFGMTFTTEKETRVLGTNGFIESDWQVNDSTNPREIDITITSGPWKGEVIKGIYRQDRLELTMAIAESGRPSNLAPGKGANVFFFRKLGAE